MMWVQDVRTVGPVMRCGANETPRRDVHARAMRPAFRAAAGRWDTTGRQGDDAAKCLFFV